MVESEELLIKKRLEWELSLSWTDIRSNAWFHGSINRSKAEQLLVSDGHFLVRTCSSKAEDYVLSTRNFGHVLHFVISRVVFQANTEYQTIRYTFEDDYFDSVSDLITFYVGNRRAISLASMAVITTPVNRTHPLTDLQFYKNKININNIELKYNSGSIDSYSSEDNRTIGLTPPPKPSRIPTLMNNSSAEDINVSLDQKLSNISLNCDNSSESSGNSSNKNGSNESEDSAFFSENVWPKTIDENIKFETKSIENLNTFESEMISTPIPEPIYSTTIRAHSFHTYLLPKENKPLEPTAIIKILSVLSDTGPRILANHLTKCDLDFINLLDINHSFGLGISSALELILLPNGQRMRSDLIERHKCLKYFICITILTAINEQKRVIVLNKWIEIALEIKTALGDLFGFASIMEALSMPPISALNNCWSLLRKDFTKNAITYETKLRPQMKSMTECSEPQAPNTTFPFILTLIQILEKHSKIIETQEKTKEKNVSEKRNSESLDLWFEQTSVDCGLQQIFGHLESGPQMLDQLSNYRRNARIVLEEIQFEDLLCDMFRTEFHRQFLFGFRGSDLECDEKFEKFDKIVLALVKKCEPNVQI